MDPRRQAADSRITKRKADNHEATNDRIHRVSKRFKALNLELNGQRLDVPFENPFKNTKPKASSKLMDEAMQVDNTANKVYIYNLDDELSDSDSSSDEAKLVFLPDIDKHLYNTRIPAQILANSDGELAGRNLHTDLVLYNEAPSSLSVPEDRDSVRKAIIETRARAREKQRRERERERTAYANITNEFSEPKPPMGIMPILDTAFTAVSAPEGALDDPDAMDID